MTNYYPNPTFAKSDGSADWYHQDNIPELGVPNGSRVSYKDAAAQPFTVVLPGENEASAVARPEATTWPVADAPANEREKFFGPKLSDVPLIYTWPAVVKLFKPWLGVWAGLYAPGLQLAAGEYTYSIEVFPDSKKQGGVYVDDPATRSEDYLRHAHYRCFAGAAYSEWKDGVGIECGAWHTLNMTYTLNEPQTIGVGIEVTALFGLENNGWFFRNPQLIARNTPAPTPTPTPTPDPSDPGDLGGMTSKQMLNIVLQGMENSARSMAFEAQIARWLNSRER